MRLTLSIPTFGPFYPRGRMHEVLELARGAEAAGVDSLIVPDHVVMGERTDRYEWGPFPFPVDAPWLEPLTVLAAIAAVTHRVRLATGILVAPLRPAVLLAKTAATLDVLSQGRLDLGVGVGWQREEFLAEGLDFEARGALLTETLAACRVLWRDAPASFGGRHVRFERIWCEPKPIQPGGPAIWFSGTLTPRNVARIAKLGDGWIPIMTATRDDLAAGVRTLREALAAARRDPASLRVRGSLDVVRGDRRPDLARTLAGAHELAAAGASDVQLPLLAFVRGPEALPDFFAELGPAWRKLKAESVAQGASAS
jgi:probable F420-dependent oxidoreductase